MQLFDLYDIALQCIYEGGPAVVRAQALLALTVEYGPYYDCTADPVYGGNPQKQFLENDLPRANAVQSFSVQPNPAKEVLTLGYNLEKYANSRLLLLDISGRKLRSRPLPQAIGQVELSLSDLPEGIYLLKVEAADRTLYQEKIVKIR